MKVERSSGLSKAVVGYREKRAPGAGCNSAAALGGTMGEIARALSCVTGSYILLPFGQIQKTGKEKRRHFDVDRTF